MSPPEIEVGETETEGEKVPSGSTVVTVVQAEEGFEELIDIPVVALLRVKVSQMV